MLSALAWIGVYGVDFKTLLSCSDTDPSSAQTKRAVEIRRVLSDAHLLRY